MTAFGTHRPVTITFVSHVFYHEASASLMITHISQLSEVILPCSCLFSRFFSISLLYQGWNEDITNKITIFRMSQRH